MLGSGKYRTFLYVLHYDPIIFFKARNISIILLAINSNTAENVLPAFHSGMNDVKLIMNSILFFLIKDRYLIVNVLLLYISSCQILTLPVISRSAVQQGKVSLGNNLVAGNYSLQLVDINSSADSTDSLSIVVNSHAQSNDSQHFFRVRERLCNQHLLAENVFIERLIRLIFDDIILQIISIAPVIHYKNMMKAQLL